MKFLSELWSRLGSPSPAFFVKLQNLGLFLGSISTLLVGIHSQFPSVQIPDTVDKIAGYLAVAGFLIAGIAKLPKQDTPSEPKP